MNLTWRQFEVYLDAFTYLMREESGEEGQRENKRADNDTIAGETTGTDRDKAIEISKRYKNRGHGVPEAKRQLLG